MPRQAQPPAPPPVAATTHVHTAGKQEDFAQAGAEIAAALGWFGGPAYVLGDIAVSDAQGFLTKTLHEHFIAGAKNDELPSAAPACEHLGIEEAAEIELLTKALAGAFQSGKGAELSAHPITRSDLGRAGLTLDISQAEQAAGKAN